MKHISLTILITSLYVLSFAQKKEHDKNVKVSEILIGSWKFDYAVYSNPDNNIWNTPGQDTTYTKERSGVFHTDTIHFFSDMTYKFRSHDTDNSSSTVHTGDWEINNNGKTLLHKKRVAIPAFVGPLPNLTFPIRVINKNRIRIDYSITDEADTRPQLNNTPVYFDRIK
ncbi:MAG TPA: hypothetical protein VGK59_03645 [Ohtaekwangia sp.]